ncbi:UvrD-helicase domain-containing protein, partial [Buchnera aphidicola]|nr:UvrD-helicase domain-containing protein [Buchnera aphidicola]
PYQVEKFSTSLLEKKFSTFYKHYDLYLRQFNILDFDDLICIPTILLKKNQSAYERWKKKVLYLLVDEYQDTNTSQYELLKILIQSHMNFTFVGDDNQSIYSWRGAQPKNILSLKKDFPDLNIIKMEHNYRSSGRILKIANSLISHNTLYFKKKLFSELKYGEPIEIIVGKNE